MNFENGIDVFGVWVINIGFGVIVVVIDFGIIKYLDLDGKVLFGYDFIFDCYVVGDGNGCDLDFFDEGDWICVGVCIWCDVLLLWYGIYVVGIIGVVINNVRGVVGVVFGVKILLV